MPSSSSRSLSACEVLALGDDELDGAADVTGRVGLADVPPAVDAAGDDQHVGERQRAVADPLGRRASGCAPARPRRRRARRPTGRRSSRRSRGRRRRRCRRCPDDRGTRVLTAGSPARRSRNACRMTAAATLSTTWRRAGPRTPASASARSAVTVREPLVERLDRHVDQRSEGLRLGPGSPGRRSLVAGQADRQADDDQLGLLVTDEGGDPLVVVAPRLRPLPAR